MIRNCHSLLTVASAIPPVRRARSRVAAGETHHPQAKTTSNSYRKSLHSDKSELATRRPCAQAPTCERIPALNAQGDQYFPR